MAHTPGSLDLIVPAHNVEEWLAECLDGILALPLEAWRAIVILDGCTDGSARIARRYAGRDSRFEVHERPHHGVGASRNYGFALGSSEYVAFIDADDVLIGSEIPAVLESLDRTRADLAIGRATEFGATISERPYWTMESGLYDGEAPRSTSLWAEPRLILDHTTWNKIYRRSFLVSNDISFPEFVSIAEDAHHTIHAICRARSVDIVPRTIYRHRARANSLTSVIRSEESVLEWARVTGEIEQIVASTGLNNVAHIWSERMLTHEAWTRARHIHQLVEDASVGVVLDLLARVAAHQTRDGWSTLPLLIRWAYDVLNVTPWRDEQRTLEEELQWCLRQLEGRTNLPEFDRFESELRQAGTELHARLWRESLLLPSLRVLDLVSPASRQGATTRVLAFREIFVAEHTLLPDEIDLLGLSASMRYDELSLRFRERSSTSATVVSLRSGPSRLDLSVRLEFAGRPDNQDQRLVGLARGRISGISRVLQSVSTGTNVGDATISVSIRHRDLRPFGRWTFGFMIRGRTGTHFIPIVVPFTSRTRLPTVLYPLAVITPVGTPLVLDVRRSLPKRASTRLKDRARSGLDIALRPGSSDGRISRVSRQSLSLALSAVARVRRRSFRAPQS